MVPQLEHLPLGCFENCELPNLLISFWAQFLKIFSNPPYLEK
jgi:hypothetical protein